jgi:hypothetical protein
MRYIVTLLSALIRQKLLRRYIKPFRAHYTRIQLHSSRRVFREFLCLKGSHMNKRLVECLLEIPIINSYIPTKKPPTFNEVANLWRSSYNAKEKTALDKFILEARKFQSDLVLKGIVGGPAPGAFVNLATITIEELLNLTCSEFIRACNAHDFTPNPGKMKLAFEERAYQLPMKFWPTLENLIKPHTQKTDNSQYFVNFETRLKKLVLEIDDFEFFLARRDSDDRKERERKWDSILLMVFVALISRLKEIVDIFGKLVHH